VRLELERRTARVESAAALPDALQQSIKSHLLKRYGTGLNVEFGVNKALIGGVRIKAGSDVYDGSVKARLAELEANF
jgi:F-type H+-transporting ATPase subunit delta